MTVGGIVRPNRALQPTAPRSLPCQLMPNAPVIARSAARMSISVAINLLVAALHLIDLRALMSPALRHLVGGYFSDLTLPFAFYYLLCLIDDRVAALRPAASKAFAVFVASSGAELLQGAGIPALGRTFDPWDFVIYATGVGLAAALDAAVLSRLVRAWPLVH
jgi:hypothetical protein